MDLVGACLMAGAATLLRELVSRDGDHPEALRELVAKARELTTRERDEHFRERRSWEVAEQPREDAGVDTGVLLQGERKVRLRRVARAI